MSYKNRYMAKTRSNSKAGSMSIAITTTHVKGQASIEQHRPYKSARAILLLTNNVVTQLHPVARE
jgi:hypothetical protein